MHNLLPHRSDLHLEKGRLYAPTASGWTRRLALGTSYLINPLVLPLVLFGLTLLHLGAPSREIFWTMGIGFFFFGLVPFAFLVWMVRTNRAGTLEVRDRQRRLRPFLIGLVSYAVGVGVLFAVGQTASPLVGTLAACILINALVLAIVTLWWKISIHAAAIAGFVSMLAFVVYVAVPASSLLPPSALYLAALLIPLVMWARVHTGAHTSGQVWAGALFGLAGPFLELYLWRYMM